MGGEDQMEAQMEVFRLHFLIASISQEGPEAESPHGPLAPLRAAEGIIVLVLAWGRGRAGQGEEPAEQQRWCSWFLNCNVMF